LKGTDAASARLQSRATLVVDPTPQNGLTKRTAFPVVPPQVFRLSRVLLLFPERHAGRLDEPVWQELQAELLRVFGDPKR
jgi:hypothetical protein